MATKRNNPQPSSPLVNDGNAGSPHVQQAVYTGEDNNHDLRSAVIDIVKNRNVRVSASGPGWIMATGMGMIRFLSKISGQNVSMALEQSNMSGPQTQLAADLTNL